MDKVKRKYGLFTGIVLVVGTVIGCGVFIKSGAVLRVTGGSLPISLLAWLVGGLIMIAGGFCFAVYATRVEKFNGCIDYIEYASNRTVGYYFGYYLGYIYFPIVTSHVAFVGASYIIAAFTDDISLYRLDSWPVLILALSLITIFFILNYFAPKIAHKFQVSILFVKIAPLLMVVIAGLFAKFFIDGGGIAQAFINPGESNPELGIKVVNDFGEAIKITSFAYDGWICVAAFNAEFKDSKKTLPKAIIFGTSAVVIFYLLYFMGASSIATNQTLINASVGSGIFSSVAVFRAMMGTVGEVLVLVLIFGSCIGSTNVMLNTTSRTLIALGIRGEGFVPEKMSRTKGDDFVLTPYLSTFILTLFYSIIWYLAFRSEINGDIPFFKYLIDMDTIVCSLAYGGYIIVYSYIIKNFKEENVAKRYIMPIVSIFGSVFFVLCGSGLYQVITTPNHDTRSLINFSVFLVLAIIVYIPGIYVYYRKGQNELPANVM